MNIFFHRDLHTKCYFNESNLVLTSMNLIEYSEKHNREMGVFIDKKSEPEQYNDAVQQVISVINEITNQNINFHPSIPQKRGRKKIYVNANKLWTSSEENHLRRLLNEGKNFKIKFLFFRVPITCRFKSNMGSQNIEISTLFP